ncbi:efflux transporter outer membrane subunit [Paraburkholderia susongensis]|uniref:Efflux transporter, outer membrane factor (OMF) lipoprotein, NodT family n=1 Tax=Paraburkholderia susongensis TaxID=1515439 RepID=A0A1X7J6Z2_9BURK|nr:efflux transporter outer membrane subunit [Paraburkholderia susongensis]SMG23097.1 efflux transporter, outer membrane factor (OMF) lipoprotein, NodT family [Paraburkholderia susongensis]
MRIFHPLPFARRAVALGVAIALAACSTLPPYSPPTVAVPAHYAGAPTAQPGWNVAAPADAALRGAWWTVFGDTDLNALEARVDVSNQTVQKAVANLQQARAMVDYQRAGFMPTIGAGVAQSRSRVSQNKLGSSLAGKTTPDYLVGLTASWEPDVFGRVRDAVAGAQASAQASAADLQAVKLSVTAELATDYFSLRSLDTQKQLLDDTVRAYADALKLLQQQLAAGAIDASAVAQAATQLESTRTQDADIDVSRAQLQHAIATLVGESASTFTLPPRVQSFADVPAIPPGLPSQLLERRPDIAASERRVAAANAQIGEAHAAFFPDLVLSASVGFESSFFAPWLSAPSLFWSLGPQLVGTLFDGGKRSASLRGANAQYDGTVADYRQTVLVAFQQVEDELSALNTLASEVDSQKRATDAADLSLRLTTNRFKAGAVSYLDVVTAQTIALTNRRLADQIAARRMEATVALLKALGGGWQDGAGGVGSASAGSAGGVDSAPRSHG